MTNDCLRFPEGFLWGTATAAHQVEGNSVNNQWWAWEQQPGRIWHGDRSGLACNWWANAEADFDRAAAMGHNTHRLSIEWSRIEPREGEFESAAIARYRQILQALHDRGLKPAVTLHHFTDPLWLWTRGSWENRESIRYFARFVERVVGELGDLVDLWCTINEPAIVAALGYLIGPHPPDKHNLVACLRVLANLLRAHAVAYRTIHRLDGRARVGIVHNVRLFDPARPASRLDRAMARLYDYLFNRLVFLAVTDGHLRFPLSLDLLGPYGPLIDSSDFLGVNYYTRDMVQFDPSRPGDLFTRRFPRPGAEWSDAGQFGTYGEVYPEGLYRVLRAAAEYGKPILVTENGLPDGDDNQRPRFLLTHLAQLWRAIQDGVPVQGYYHWSLIDNFEWAEGWALRFGLIEFDPATQVRQVRRSGELYAEIAWANGITRDMVARYAPEVTIVP
jgi:beta-glucosidase